MIQSLRNKHEGSTIAVIGSGPTAQKFAAKEDVSIAINGGVLVDQPLTYFQAFDLTLDKKEYFYKKPEVTRIIGAGLAPVDKLLYPNLQDRLRRKGRGHTVKELELPVAPKEPHCFFLYERRVAPAKFNPELKVLSSAGNIAICAVETAFIMGAKAVHIYGIDLAERLYFYERKPRGHYPMMSIKYMDSLLDQAIKNGIDIKVSRGQNTNVTRGEDL